MLTPEQLQQRKQGIGGSDAAAVCGLSKWKTPLDIYRDKTSDEISLVETKAMRRGRIFESAIIRLYEEETGYTVSTLDTINKGFMLANCDGFVTTENKIVEIKTARNKDGWGQSGSDDIPTDYLLQVAHYCHVLDIPTADIAVFFSDDDFRIYHYQRNSNLEKKLIEKEYTFWHEYVLPNTPPPPITLEDINHYWQPVIGKSLEASNDIVKAISNIQSIKTQLKALQQEKASLEKTIKAYMQDSEMLNYNGHKLASWRHIKSSRFDQASFSQSHPELYQQFKQEQYHRTFIVK